MKKNLHCYPCRRPNKNKGAENAGINAYCLQTNLGAAFLKPSLAVKIFIVFALLLAVTEASLGWAKNQPSFFRFFHNQIPSAEILSDLLAANTRNSKPLIVILGDSVVYGSGLHAHGVRAWRDQTIAAFLQKQLPQFHVVDLSLDGALPGDYLALYSSVRRLKPTWVILEFNYRMYAQKYSANADMLSRPWLGASQTNPLFPRPQLSSGDKIAAVLRNSLLFRYTEALRSAVYFPSREEVFNQILQSLLPARSWQDPMDKELLLKLKLKPYYYAPVLSPEHAALQAGHLLLDALDQDRQPSILFFTPQNLAFIEDIADQNAFSQNLGILDASLNTPKGSAWRQYFDWFNLYPQKAFFDHCHLVPRYNELLAEKLTAVILGSGQREHVLLAE